MVWKLQIVDNLSFSEETKFDVEISSIISIYLHNFGNENK